MGTLNRSDLVTQLSARFPELKRQDADAVVNTILESIETTLQRGGRIEIRGFGSFALNERPARMGRNPKTGETVKVAAKRAVHFKAGLDLRKRVDRQPK